MHACVQYVPLRSSKSCRLGMAGPCLSFPTWDAAAAVSLLPLGNAGPTSSSLRSLDWVASLWVCAFLSASGSGREADAIAEAWAFRRVSGSYQPSASSPRFLKNVSSMHISMYTLYFSPKNNLPKTHQDSFPPSSLKPQTQTLFPPPLCVSLFSSFISSNDPPPQTKNPPPKQKTKNLPSPNPPLPPPLDFPLLQLLHHKPLLNIQIKPEQRPISRKVALAVQRERAEG